MARREEISRTLIRLGAMILVTILGFISIPGDLWAGPPFFTDDPEPVDYRHWEFYLASQQAWDRIGVSGSAPHFEINYGLAPDMMLHLIAPLNFNKPAGKSLQVGLGDMELGLKFRFVQEAKERPQVGVFPHIEVPTGSLSRGLGSGKLQLFLPVWAQKSWGPWKTYGGGGYWINPGSGNKNYWSFGWEVQRDLSGSITVGAELFGNTASSIGEAGQTGFNLGAIISLGRGHQLLVSAGRQFQGPGTFFLYVAYYVMTGPGD